MVQENAATRAMLIMGGILRDHDWDGAEAMHSPNASFFDRRAGLQTEVIGRDSVMAWIREMGSLGLVQEELEVIATRGEQLALASAMFRDIEAGFEIPSLMVGETDADGRVVNLFIFDPDDRDAAFAELDERYASGEGRPTKP